MKTFWQIGQAGLMIVVLIFTALILSQTLILEHEITQLSHINNAPSLVGWFESPTENIILPSSASLTIIAHATPANQVSFIDATGKWQDKNSPSPSWHHVCPEKYIKGGLLKCQLSLAKLKGQTIEIHLDLYGLISQQNKLQADTQFVTVT